MLTYFRRHVFPAIVNNSLILGNGDVSFRSLSIASQRIEADSIPGEHFYLNKTAMLRSRDASLVLISIYVRPLFVVTISYLDKKNVSIFSLI